MINNSDRMKDIFKMIGQGFSYSEIGKKYNITKQRVNYIVDRERKRSGAMAEEEGKNIFYCQRCKRFFETRLKLEDAVCVKCGSEKIDMDKKYEKVFLPKMRA